MNDKQEGLDKEHIVIRTFHLKHRSSLLPDRTITHLQYAGWPDLSVPNHPMGLLQLIHLADEAFKIHHEEIGPVTVHCSAGCGRTGTFCVVDTVIQRLWHDRDVYTSSTIDKVQETIGQFREQRMSVVQTHRQYVFCYEAVLWWLLGYGHLPATPTSPNLSLFFDEDDALADREDNDDDDITSTSDIIHNF
jgi:protein-tyrosine phosphatase